MSMYAYSFSSLKFKMPREKYPRMELCKMRGCQIHNTYFLGQRSQRFYQEAKVIKSIISLMIASGACSIPEIYVDSYLWHC